MILGVLILNGCDCKESSPQVENKARNGWSLEYYHKVKINNEELYECVYSRSIGYNSATAFSVLSNTRCLEML